MKWKLLMLLLSIELVAGDGAWKENLVYKYKIQSYTKANGGAIVFQGDLSIYPQSDVLLIGKINQAKYGITDGQFLSQDDLDLSDVDMPNELSLNKLFAIHLENAVIRSISVDRSMSKKEIKQLSAIISQLQVDTNAQNLLQSKDNHLPVRGSNNAFYKTMEPDATGNCETHYDISILSDYLIDAHPKWIPLPKLKGQGDFIKIEKTRNFNNCKERNDFLAAYKGRQNDFQSNSNSDEINAQRNTHERSAEQRTSGINSRILSPATRVVISGNLQSYVIQSSATFGKNGDSDDYLEVTLESVQEVQNRPIVSQERLINVGNLAKVFDVEYRDWDRLRPSNETQSNGLQNLQGAEPRCPKAENAEERWSGCYTGFVSGEARCRQSFSMEWEHIEGDMCGFLGLGVKSKCRRSFPGCIDTTCWTPSCSEYPNVPVRCGGSSDCSPGWYRSRCCPSSYQ
ncbi:Vitellogenin-A1 [Pseudolycoriella hygida]|uniref:Vitellogenin-A1 n=1 Tax=Pseudolycoriella hygida TaxID=35572 RepID=A0A9Q0S4X5_9DIPT|nr:Vitellogenin-A1 [Pseudolycoriella hygida]